MPNIAITCEDVVQLLLKWYHLKVVGADEQLIPR